MNPDQADMKYIVFSIGPEFFLLVDLRDFFFRFRVVGTKKKK